MKNNIINTASILIAVVLFLLPVNTINGQSDKNPDVFKKNYQNFAYHPPIAPNQENYNLLPSILLDFEDAESSCEYLQEYPNVCVVLA